MSFMIRNRRKGDRFCPHAHTQASAHSPVDSLARIGTTLLGHHFCRRLRARRRSGSSVSVGAVKWVTTDTTGNVFFTSYSFDTVFRVDPTGVLTRIAGTGAPGSSGDNGPAAAAQFSSPAGVAVDAAGNLYIADSINRRVRKVSNSLITTVASGWQAEGVAVDADGNLFVTDVSTHAIRKISVAGSVSTITTVAGNGTQGFSGDGGPALSAQLNYPSGVAVDASGNIYFSDTNRIRKISNGLITTIAGDGTSGFSGDGGSATSARLSLSVFVGALTVDAFGNVFIADYGNRRIRRVSNGVIDTVVAPDQLNALPAGVAVDSAGNIYVATDSGNSILRVTKESTTTVAGNGKSSSGDGELATRAQMFHPPSVLVDAIGTVYIGCRKVVNGVITTVADLCTSGSVLAVDGLGRFYTIASNRISRISNGTVTAVAGNGTLGFSGDDGPATSAGLGPIYGAAADSNGDLYLAELNRIRKVSKGIITTVAGDGTAGFSGDNGPASLAEINNATCSICNGGGVAVGTHGDVYIADLGNYRIRRISNGVITTVAGGGTSLAENVPATEARLGNPTGITVDIAGDFYFDSGDGRVRRVSHGVIETVADGLGGILGVAVDATGNVYISDQYNNRVQVAIPAPGTFVLPPPMVSANGVAPVFSTSTIIQPGEWVSIYGSNLAAKTTTWSGDFPISLGGTSVTINGKAAYLSLVSPSQINLQAPDDTATGVVPVVVTTPSGSFTSTVTLAQFGPSFNLLDSKHATGIILRSGTGAYGGGTYDIIGPTGSSLGYPTVAAQPGDSIELFGVGFGPTSPAVQAGQAFVGAARTTNTVDFLIGNVKVTPSFAGLSSAGLYQFNLTVPAGLGSGDLSLSATVGGVSTPSGVVISMQSGSTAPRLQSVSLSQSSVQGGGSVTGTVTLSAAAPSAGALVALASSSTNAAVPATVTIQAGATTATFTVSTVSADTATITASFGGVSVQASLVITSVVVVPRLQSLTLSQSAVAGGGPVTGTVALSAVAPSGGTVVALASSAPNSATVPATVTVPAGSTSATFSITTSAVASGQSVTISATYNGVTQTATLSVDPAPVTLLGLTLSVQSVVGGNSVTGTVRLSGPAPVGGVVVALRSSASAATVPASVTVTSGLTSTPFNIATNSVTASQSATITATYSGASQTASLSINPAPVTLSSISLSASAVTGGSSVTGTVRLSGPAPTGGVVVVLRSSASAATVPSSVTVGLGLTSVVFNIVTSSVTSSQAATITASYAGDSLTASLTVAPPPTQASPWSKGQIFIDATLSLEGKTVGAAITSWPLASPAFIGSVDSSQSALSTGILMDIAFDRATVSGNTITYTGANSASFYVNLNRASSETIISATLIMTINSPSRGAAVSGSLKLSTTARTLESAVVGTIQSVN